MKPVSNPSEYSRFVFMPNNSNHTTISSNHSASRCERGSKPKNILLAKLLLPLLAVLMVLTNTARAVVIPLNNASLEAGVSGWVDPGSANFTNWAKSGRVGSSPVAHDGSQGLWNCWGYGWNSLSQNSSYTVTQAGETLTAGVWAKTDGNVGPAGVWFNLTLRLDGAAVASTQPNIAAGQDWIQLTATYVTTAADIGKTVGIAFGMDGGANSSNPNYCYMDQASLSYVTPGAPTVIGSASPNPVSLGESILVTVMVTNGSSPNITSVTLNATAIGGGSAVVLNFEEENFYSNTITVASATVVGSPLTMVATVTDDNGLSGTANISLIVNPPSDLTWGGGTGNWTDTNWLPFNISGPFAMNQNATITGGVVTANRPGGVSEVGTITVSGGTLNLTNAQYNSYANIFLSGGTLDGNGSYNAYGASILSALTAKGETTSTISGTSWFNLPSLGGLFTVENGSALTISAQLRGSVNGADDTQYLPATLIKQGPGTLSLSGTNLYTGNTAINDGVLVIPSSGSLRFRPTGNGVTNSVSGTATATLTFLGSIDLVLSAAETTDGNAWNLINIANFSGPAPTLTPTAVTSNLGSFNEVSPGLWELSLTGAKWTFTESTGDLTYATVALTPYETWGAAYGLSAGSEGGDLDNDGLTNHQEYAFGLNPNSSTSVNPILVQLSKTAGTFTYQRRDPALSGMSSYKIMTSTDLITWTQDTTAEQIATAIPATENQSVAVTLTTPPTSEKFFIRVSAN